MSKFRYGVVGLKYLTLIFLLCQLQYSEMNAQSARQSITSLFDSLATAPEMHRGPIGFGGAITPRSLWLDSLIVRRSEWFHLDSLDSKRITTRVVTLFSIDSKDEELLFSIYSKMLSDTARVLIGRGCVFLEYTLADLAKAPLYQTYRSGIYGSELPRHIKCRLDSIRKIWESQSAN